MTTETRIGNLPESSKRLVRVMQAVNFGRIDGLVVREGQPVFDPPPRVLREIKLGGENDARQETGLGDFGLKRQVVELFDHLNRFGEGVLETLEIKHGLPFRMTVRETIRP